MAAENIFRAADGAELQAADGEPLYIGVGAVGYLDFTFTFVPSLKLTDYTVKPEE